MTDGRVVLFGRKTANRLAIVVIASLLLPTKLIAEEGLLEESLQLKLVKLSDDDQIAMIEIDDQMVTGEPGDLLLERFELQAITADTVILLDTQQAVTLLLNQTGQSVLSRRTPNRKVIEVARPGKGL